MGIFKDLANGYRIAGNVKSLIFISLLIGGCIVWLYSQSKDGNLSLFIVASAIEVLVISICTRKLLSHKMRFKDFLGNIFTFGLIIYLALFVAVRVFPEIQMDGKLLSLYIDFSK